MSDTTPKLVIYDAATDATNVTTWTVTSGGSDKVRAGTNSDILSVHAWNNKGVSTDVSDIIDATVTVVNSSGGTTGVVPENEWVLVNLNGEVDSSSKTVWHKLGKTVYAIRAKGITPANAASPVPDTEDVIKGTANDGTAANSLKNYADLQFAVNIPISSTPGAQTFKIRFEGYYV